MCGCSRRERVEVKLVVGMSLRRIFGKPDATQHLVALAGLVWCLVFVAARRVAGAGGPRVCLAQHLCQASSKVRSLHGATSVWVVVLSLAHIDQSSGREGC